MCHSMCQYVCVLLISLAKPPKGINKVSACTLVIDCVYLIIFFLPESRCNILEFLVVWEFQRAEVTLLKKYLMSIAFIFFFSPQVVTRLCEMINEQTDFINPSRRFYQGN